MALLDTIDIGENIVETPADAGADGFDEFHNSHLVMPTFYNPTGVAQTVTIKAQNRGNNDPRIPLADLDITIPLAPGERKAAEPAILDRDIFNDYTTGRARIEYTDPTGLLVSVKKVL